MINRGVLTKTDNSEGSDIPPLDPLPKLWPVGPGTKNRPIRGVAVSAGHRVHRRVF